MIGNTSGRVYVNGIKLFGHIVRRARKDFRLTKDGKRWFMPEGMKSMMRLYREIKTPESRALFFVILRASLFDANDRPNVKKPVYRVTLTCKKCGGIFTTEFRKESLKKIQCAS